VLTLICGIEGSGFGENLQDDKQTAMLIIGAKGFAQEVLEILYQLNALEDVAFYDDRNHDLPEKLYGRFPILNNLNEAKNYFRNRNRSFTVGIGNPVLRRKMRDKFENVGGVFSSTISPKAIIGHFGTSVGIGSNIITGTIIDNSVTIGTGCLCNTNSIIAHDCIIGEFSEVCPSAVLSGNCTIGAYSFIGTNATILPKITIGSNVIIAAGAVVTKDIPNDCVVAGNPASIKKVIPRLEF
jgi:sugar O-acyltransferase (sialic acid O-acetyltransferase NeuD family)